jgi:hypothetical protein
MALKKKAEKNGSIAVRVPKSAQNEYVALRKIGDGKGVDLSGSLTDLVLAWLKTARKELGIAERSEVTKAQSNGLSHERESNGAEAHRGGGGIAR